VHGPWRSYAVLSDVTPLWLEKRWRWPAAFGDTVVENASTCTLDSADELPIAAHSSKCLHEETRCKVSIILDWCSQSPFRVILDLCRVVAIQGALSSLVQ
jgi:hypothetical protein